MQEWTGRPPSPGDRGRSSTSRTYNEIRSAIRAGYLDTSKPLDERLMMRAFQSTRSAVRDALTQLAEDGLIVRAQRTGTHIIKGLVQISSHQTMVQHDAPSGPGGGNVEVLTVTEGEIPASALIQRKLECTDSHVQMMQQIVYWQQALICCVTAYHRIDRSRQIPRATSVDELDIADMFYRYHGVALHRMESEFEASIAGHRLAGLLEVPTGSPVLMREVRFIDVDDVVRGFQHIDYRADRVSVKAHSELVIKEPPLWETS